RLNPYHRPQVKVSGSPSKCDATLSVTDGRHATTDEDDERRTQLGGRSRQRDERRLQLAAT
ncbi:unnamed protein product, partial [Ectocarpus sp. 12 AP-2014]